VIKNFNENENIYLNPKIWYLKKDINNYCERLYKS
jgi:hypothetical protein